MFDIPRFRFLPASILFGMQDPSDTGVYVVSPLQTADQMHQRVEQIEAKVEGFQQTIEVVLLLPHHDS